MLDHHPYPTDLTEKQWAIIAPLFPPAKKLGRQRADLRRIFDAILYLLRTGCAWRMLPHDFSKWRTVYGHYREWTQTGLLEQILHVLRATDRVQEGRSSEPTAAILDSQSIRTTEGGEARGYDAGKKITGRKRHLLVDTDGRLLSAAVGSASIQDRQAALPLISKEGSFHSHLRCLWADGGYAGALIQQIARLPRRRPLRLQIVPRSRKPGFHVLPRRWVVERTISWLMRYRRLRADYERLTAHSCSMIILAMIHLLLKRLA